jgi:hypothetical protein
LSSGAALLPRAGRASRITGAAGTSRCGARHGSGPTADRTETDGQWHLLFSNGIPPETTAALQQLAEEIIVELMGQNDELKDEVAREVKKKKDDDDRTNRKLRQMGFKTPQSSSMVK